MSYSMIFRFIFALTGLFFLAMATAGDKEAKPNILLIIGDDLAYGDLNRFGSQIYTPTFDAIAKQGLTFTNFHATPVCSVTRSELITGNSNHQVGLGGFDETLYPPVVGKPGYETYLTRTTVTIAELLRDAGYETFKSGKWHLGGDKSGGWGSWEWGFTRSFGITAGLSNHWNDMSGQPDVKSPEAIAKIKSGGMIGVEKVKWYLDGKPYERPDGVYSNHIYTDYMLEFIQGAEAKGKPWFAWMAYTTPHFPIQAPAGRIDHYFKIYRKLGYKGLKHNRYEQMKKLGIINDSSPEPALNAIAIAWESLSDEQKDYQARVMATYAAMIEDQDRSIARLLDHLKETNNLHKTLVIYLSDNGPEGLDPFNPHTGSEFTANWMKANFDSSADNIGTETSENFIGVSWANAATGGLSWWKWFIGEGGIRTPLMIVPPGGFSTDYAKAGELTDAVLSVRDIPMTILDYAGINHPKTKYQDRDIAPPSGITIRPYLEGANDEIRTDAEPWAFELFGNMYVMAGEYKAIKVRLGMFGDGKWHLYNVVDDPGETTDLAKKHPARLEKMIAFYKQYAAENDVLEVVPMWSPFEGLSGAAQKHSKEK